MKNVHGDDDPFKKMQKQQEKQVEKSIQVVLEKTFNTILWIKNKFDKKKEK